MTHAYINPIGYGLNDHILRLQKQKQIQEHNLRPTLDRPRHKSKKHRPSPDKTYHLADIMLQVAFWQSHA